MSFQPNQNNNDDIFASLPSSGNSSGNSGNLPPYVPPPPPPTQKKGPNTLLLILLGTVIGALCICGACFAVFGSSIMAVVNNPTFQAAVGSGVALVNVPTSVPTDATNKGELENGQSETSSSSSSDFTGDLWTYKGQSGDKLTVTVTTQTSSLVLLGVYDSGGSLIGKTDFSSSSSSKKTNTLTVTLPNTGTYSILVKGIAASYTIKVTS